MQEQGYKDPLPIDYNAVGKSMLDRMKDSGIKEQLLKKIEEKEKEQLKRLLKY